MDQMIKTRMEKPVTALSPAVPGASPAQRARTALVPGRCGGDRAVRDLCHSPTSSHRKPVHSEHQTRVRQGDDREHDTHRAGIAELALTNGR